jgi:hypothetical protein
MNLDSATVVNRGNSGPSPIGSANAQTREEQTWLPYTASQTQGKNVQRTLQDLAISPMDALPQRAGDTTSGSSYVNSGSSNGADTGLSPDTSHSNSNRPTPSASTPSESLSSLQARPTNSGSASFETSPASTHARAPTTTADGRSMQAFFSGQPDYNGIQPTGLTPDNNFSLPETPGRQFDVPSGWEMSNQSNLTPVGEGVFRHLMGLGSMDPM